MVRCLNIDVQVDVRAFACFIAAFFDIEGFDSMPWGERERLLSEYYGVNVCERTLRNWSCKLIKYNIMTKQSEKTKWKTYFIGDCKHRKRV